MPPERFCHPQIEGCERELADAAFSVPGWWPRAGFLRRGAGARHTVGSVERRGVIWWDDEPCTCIG